MHSVFSIIGTESPDHQCFAQPNLPHVCRHWRLFLRMNANSDYPIRCRKPRCSLACYQQWRAKEAATLRRFLVHHLPDDAHSYRGNLTLHQDASTTDHKHVVAKFLRTLRRREHQTGRTFRVYLTAHVTAPNAQHYDLLAYTDATATKFRDVIRDAWLSAGGLRYSLAGIDTEEEKVKAAKYTAKDTTAERNKYVYLPAANGLNLTRCSSGFFNGTTKEALWDECIRQWFGTEGNADIVSNYGKPLYDTNDDPKSAPSDATEGTIEGQKAALKALDNKERDYALSLIRRYLPRTADDAIALTDLSTRVSIPTTLLLRLLANLPGSVKANKGYWFR